MPKLLIKNFQPQQSIDTTFVVIENELRTAKNGTPFLSLKLKDASGEIVGRMWEGAEAAMSDIPCKGVVRVRGRTELFRGELQLNVGDIFIVPAGEFDPRDFLPSCPRDTDMLFEELRLLFTSLKNKALQLLVRQFFSDTELMARFKLAPAAKSVHHAYLGGLLEHTLGVCRLAVTIANHYEYVDRDLLVTGALLHDVGKVDEFVYDLFIDYSHSGRLIGHIVQGVQILEEKIRSMKHFPASEGMLLKHMILSHHGEIDRGAVRLPMTREALALHLADDLDAKMDSLSKIITENKGGDIYWSSYQGLYQRFFLRGLPGSEETTDPFPEKKDRVVQLSLWPGCQGS